MGDRQVIGRHLELRFMKHAPDTVLVHVKASPEVIRRRMKESPHKHPLVQEKDVEHVLERFEEEDFQLAAHRVRPGHEHGYSGGIDSGVRREHPASPHPGRPARDVDPPAILIADTPTNDGLIPHPLSTQTGQVKMDG